jgi:hypothetical protein
MTPTDHATGPQLLLWALGVCRRYPRGLQASSPEGCHGGDGCVPKYVGSMRRVWRRKSTRTQGLEHCEHWLTFYKMLRPAKLIDDFCTRVVSKCVINRRDEIARVNRIVLWSCRDRVATTIDLSAADSSACQSSSSVLHANGCDDVVDNFTVDIGQPHVASAEAIR